MRTKETFSVKLFRVIDTEIMDAIRQDHTLTYKEAVKKTYELIGVLLGEEAKKAIASTTTKAAK